MLNSNICEYVSSAFKPLDHTNISQPGSSAPQVVYICYVCCYVFVVTISGFYTQPLFTQAPYRIVNWTPKSLLLLESTYLNANTII